MTKEIVLAERITSNPDVMLGKPVIRGTRIPVYILVEMIGAGETPEDLVDAYPELTLEDIDAAIAFDAEMQRHIDVRAL